MNTYRPLTIFTIADEPRMTDEQHEQLVMENRSRTQHVNAVLRLWGEVCRRIECRHPDANVNVNLVATKYNGGVNIWFVLSNMRDTRDQDRKMEDGFIHYGKPGLAWPGYEAAEKYITAIWTLYMIHEGLELVTYRDKRIEHFNSTINTLEMMQEQVVAAHDINGAHQKILAKGTGDIPKMLDMILGDGVGQNIVDRGVARAYQDIMNELEPWEPGT